MGIPTDEQIRNYAASDECAIDAGNRLAADVIAKVDRWKALGLLSDRQRNIALATVAEAVAAATN